MTDTYQKGEEFEAYVENKIFIKKDYGLIHRTGTHEQNKERYAEETRKPDFKFRCNQTGIEFYVEAKFRSRFNSENKLDIISYEQIERFKKINTPTSPVFIVIGYEGSPGNPGHVSLIRVDELEHLELYRSYLEKFKIDKGPLPNKNLKLKLESKKHSNGEPDTPDERPDTPDEKNKLIKKIGISALIIIVLITVILISNNINFTLDNLPAEDPLKTQKTSTQDHKAPKTEKEIISEIRENFGAINYNIASYKKIKKDLIDQGGGELAGYFKNKELKKMVATYNGKMGKEVSEYYFWINELFFVYTYDKPISMDNSKVDNKNENRYYFYDNKLIRWLDPDDKKVFNFNPRGDEVLNSAIKLKNIIVK